MTTITSENLTLNQHAEALAAFIGNTPLYDFSHLLPGSEVKVFGKLEWYQLGSSVKARAAYRIVSEGIRQGLISQKQTIVDATSGNTGIALAAIGAKLGIPVQLFMPENASIERVLTLRAYGAKIVLTDPVEGTDGAQGHARKLVASDPERYFYADQYGNPENWKAHFYSTADEILQQTSGAVTHFVAALGTSGSFSGTAKKLRQENPAIRLISLQPDGPMHAIEGWKHMETAAIVPKIYDPTIADSSEIVTTEEALEMVVRVAREQGLLISPSSAGNLVGALKVAQKLSEGTVVTILPDSAERNGEIIQELFKA